MTMAAGVNTVAAILFLISWALYLVAEAARTGAESKPQCDNADNSEEAKKLCNGYAAAAVWFIFGTVASLVAAGLSARLEVRNLMFMLSLALAAIAYTCEYGGKTSAIDEGGKSSYGDEYTDLKNGYGAGTVFFFFAFLAAISCAIMLGRYADRLWMGILTFFTFLGLWSIGLTGVYGGVSKYYCDQNNTGDTGKADNSFCDGYGFGAFVEAVAFVGSLWFAFLAYKSREDTSKLWIGWFVFALLSFLAYTSVFAANAQVYCNYITDFNNDKKCDGYSAAAFFVMLAMVAAVLGLVFACRQMENFMHVMFMFSFSLFFLGYASYLGGQSVYNCKQDQDNADSNNTMGYDDLCDGYGAATFFSICAFVFTAIGSYFAYQGGDDAGPHQQMQDTAYPAGRDGLPPTTVTATIDDDYNKP
jgi:hypothetical protein